VKKPLLVVAALLAVLGLVAFGADRAVASVAQNTINDRVAASFPGVTSTSTSISGIPVLTQVARGSLDHVTVRMVGVPTSGGLTLETVDVDLYGVSTSAPRTASTVDARAQVSTAALQAQVGSRYVIAPEGDLLVASLASGLPVEARLRPTVADGKIRLDLVSVTLLGISVDSSRLPASLTERITSLVGSLGELPLGLVATSATVTPTGVLVVAHGTEVPIEAA
jgi:hypothetical protein